MIVNPTSLTISQLLGNQSEQYVIPSYQRRYSWHEKQLWEFLDDILLIEGSDNHLLGTIVCLVGHYAAGVNKLELVDGQQRITTINILLHCLLERMRGEGENAEAQSIESLLNARALGGPVVRKIALDSIDAEEFEKHAALNVIENPENSSLALAFSIFRDWVSRQPLANLGSFLYRLKNQAVVIRLDVSNAKDAFKLFETINNRGLKLSAPDIIKNFILGNAARFGEPSLALAKSKWSEVIKHLDGTNFENFFRHFLAATLKKRVTAAYVVSSFKTVFMQQVLEAATLPDRHWYADDIEPLEEDEATEEVDNAESTPQKVVLDGATKVSFAGFLERLAKYAKIYGQIVAAKTDVPALNRHLRNLRMIKSVQTYGFLMALRAGGCSDEHYTKVLALTEAFMLRRHICRERANDNESAFARLCGVDPFSPIPAIQEEFRRLAPSDDAFIASFSKFDFTANLIERARYCLECFELHKQGEYVELVVGGADLVHVEHIIPQKIKSRRNKDEFGDWPSYLGDKSEAQHPHFVSRIGNLSLFAGSLNIGASNGPYERKKAAYCQSAIKITNSLPDEYPEFRFAEVDTRSREFAEAAAALWPIA